jgi:glutamate synthase (NADPH/NADH) large chain
LPVSAEALIDGGYDAAGLYSPTFEKESCGFGSIENLDDQASHWLVRTAIESLNRLTHRGAVAAGM